MISTRTAIKRRRKPRRGPVVDEDYKAWIRTLPCVLCQRYITCAQLTPTEAAHVGVRGLGQKCSDRETIPLCAYDHREGGNSAHKLGKGFWARHGINKEALIAKYQEAYEEQNPN